MRLEEHAVDLLEVDGLLAVSDGFEQGGETSVGAVSGVIGLELGASRAVDVLNTYDALPAWVPTLSPAPPTTHC